MTELPGLTFKFSSKITISPSQVFYLTDLSYAFVNIRPVVPGLFLYTHQTLFIRLTS